VFAENDHRRHRTKGWLVDGVQKVEAVRFLETPERTLGQGAMQWLLHEPAVATVLPNIYDVAQINEFAATSESPPVTDEEFTRVEALWETGFDIEPYAGDDATVLLGELARD
jgi:aryl-alcohol dehydrogenase-like predicted oxidoreductase